jgi:hypothetical protein
MKTKIDKVVIKGVTYVPESSVKHEIVEFTGKETIASRLIGKKVIVRSRNEGINSGIVVLADETGIELKESRRLWRHYPKDKNLSWYEGVCVSGISDKSTVSVTVSSKFIIENYSATPCSDETFQTIMEITPNAQN